MTKLCFGGSFNPIHVGHLVVARAVAEAKGFNRVLLVPSGRPPHKGDAADLADGCHRLKMCHLVSQSDSLFEVDGLELKRSGPSFTLDTVRALKSRGWPEVVWLIGADMVPSLPQWHRPVELLKEVKLLIARRPGEEIDWNLLPAEFRVLEKEVVTAPLLDISASGIRRRVREGKSVRYLVSPEVERYIFDQRLYGASPA